MYSTCDNPDDLARLFIYTHSAYYLENGGLQVAAQKALNRIAEFNARPVQSRPPIMLTKEMGLKPCPLGRLLRYNC